MQINISEQANKWFQDEMYPLKETDGIRFFGKVYGKTNVHDGFSLGMKRDNFLHAAYKIKPDSLTYFITEDDEWFFDGLNLNISFDEKNNEPRYEFVPEIRS